MTMKTSDFFFDLPEELIAKYPSKERGGSRLMVLDRRSGLLEHCMVMDLPEILLKPQFRSPNGELPLMIFNNSHVRKARLKTVQTNENSSKTEILLLTRIDPHTWKVLVNRAKRHKPGSRFMFADGMEGEIVEVPIQNKAHRSTEFRFLRFDTPIDDDWLDINGTMPLPPYIKRDTIAADSERYQTIYADHIAGKDLGPGASSAAPTAGLHFTNDLLSRLKAAGIESVFITLHVGLGTFLPVRTEYISDHVMHEEVYTINNETAEIINSAKAAGRKIITVGTTSLRTLESAYIEIGNTNKPYIVKAGEGSTSIFIYPGYCFKFADALFTNFHTPSSTLLMLVSAFASNSQDKGLELILGSYTEAIKEKYRFFSYGDAMLIC